VPTPQDQLAVLAALERKIEELNAAYPGLAVERQDEQFWVSIPDRYRVGHEAHFAEVTRKFLGYVHDPTSLPTWEQVNMLAKYWLTTNGVKLAQSFLVGG
jgi:hypothetical protein